MSGTYCPGDGEGAADWHDLAGFGEVDGVSAGTATAGYGDGRGEAGKRGGERDDGELHFGIVLRSTSKLLKSYEKRAKGDSMYIAAKGGM